MFLVHVLSGPMEVCIVFFLPHRLSAGFYFVEFIVRHLPYLWNSLKVPQSLGTSGVAVDNAEKKYDTHFSSTMMVHSSI